MEKEQRANVVIFIGSLISDGPRNTFIFLYIYCVIPLTIAGPKITVVSKLSNHLTNSQRSVYISTVCVKKKKILKNVAIEPKSVT